jgi:hypothetical protein
MFRRDVHFGFYFHLNMREKLTVRFSGENGVTESKRQKFNWRRRGWAQISEEGVEVQ